MTEARELALHGSLSFSGYEAPRTLPMDKWIADGSALVTMDKALRFAIGDWVLVGERNYGEAHAQAIKTTALSYESINAARWVSSRIPPIRRRTNLSWTHHEAVASLEPDRQDDLLNQAERYGWDRGHLRARVRELKGLPPAAEMLYLPATKVEEIKRERDEARRELADVRQSSVKVQQTKKEVPTVTLPIVQVDELKKLARHADLDAQERYMKKWSDEL